jgi:hypothetical protein
MSEIAATPGWGHGGSPAPDDFPPPLPDDLEAEPDEAAGLIEYERMHPEDPGPTLAGPGSTTAGGTDE